MTVEANDLTVNEALFARASQLLNEKNNLENETFREKLILNYQKQLLQTIITILVGATEKANALETLLQENWDLVKCTYLCYTAHPEDSLTELLCDIAEYVGQRQNKPALNVLMPGISPDSAHDAYPDLTGESAQNIKQILKSHILSESGAYLIPIRLLNEWGSSDKQCNPYFDYELHNAEDAFLKKGEFERLSTHSADARAISEAQAQYEVLLNDNGLLGHLQELIRSLRFNDAGGIGSETHAGEPVYNAIIRFNAYYFILNDQIKNEIPEAVKTELDLFISLSSDSTKNINATENMATCIADRGSALSRVVKAHENALSEIGIDGNKKRNLLESIKKQIETNKQALIQKIDEKTYVGNDNLGLTLALLERLGLKPRVSSLADLNDFMTLTAKEIKEVTETDDVLQSDIIQQFTTLESFVVFSVDVPLEQFKALLPIINHQLREKLINSASDLSACLMPLVDVRFELIFNTFSEQVIKNSRDFQRVLEHLAPDQRTVIFNIVKDAIPQIIKSSEDFQRTLLHLTPAQRAVIFNAMKDVLPKIIKNSIDFQGLFESLNLEQRAAVFGTMQDMLPRIIKNNEDFQRVIQPLVFEQRSIVCNAMKDALPKIIKNIKSFRRVIRFLALEQGRIVCNAMKDVLPQMVKNEYEFSQGLQYLSPEKRAVVFNVLKDSLPQIIKRGVEFQNILRYLTPEQCAVAYEQLKNTLPSFLIIIIIAHFSDEKLALFLKASPTIFNSANCLGNLLSQLDVKLAEKVLDAIKDDLPEIINNEENYNHVLLSCDDAQSSKREAISKKIQELMLDKELTNLRSSLNLAPTSAFDLYRKRARDSEENASLHCPSSKKAKYNNNPGL